MKKGFILIALFTFAVIANAQTDKLIGSWLMTKVEVKDKTNRPYQIFDFKKDGKFMAMGMEFGTWQYKKKGKKIVFKSTMDKDFNGEGKIIELTSGKIVIKKDGAKYSYSRLKPKKIAEANKKSKLAGIWKIESAEFSSSLLKFELPDEFTLIQSVDGMTETHRGTWIYKNKQKTILLIGFSSSLKGKSKIKKQTKNRLVLENKGQTIKGKRLKPEAVKIERLTFKEEDLPEEYTGEYQLPWVYFEEMVSKLKNVKHLKYKYGKLLEEFNTLIYTSSIVSKVEVNADKQSVRFTNLSISRSDTSQFSENYKGGLMERSNQFFPKEEPWPYRITGIENVTVPAGTFACTVVEGFDSETKIKYWMINDRPGIYAKIITEKTDVFDKLEYRLFELEEIKKKNEN